MLTRRIVRRLQITVDELRQMDAAELIVLRDLCEEEIDRRRRGGPA